MRSLYEAAQPSDSVIGSSRAKAQRFAFIIRLMRSTNVRLVLRRMMNLKGSGRFHFHVLDHLIDQPVFQRFLGRHELVAIGVLLDLARAGGRCA